VLIAVVHRQLPVNDDVRRVVGPRPEGVIPRHRRRMEHAHDQVRILLPLVAELHLSQGLLLLRRSLESRELEVVVKVAIELLGPHSGRRG